MFKERGRVVFFFAATGVINLSDLFDDTLAFSRELHTVWFSDSEIFADRLYARRKGIWTLFLDRSWPPLTRLIFILV